MSNVCMYIHRTAYIAWCISDQETIEVVELFLQSIKKQSPDSSVSVFMTDDGWLHGIKKIIFSP